MFDFLADLVPKVQGPSISFHPPGNWPKKDGHDKYNGKGIPEIHFVYIVNACVDDAGQLEHQHANRHQDGPSPPVTAGNEPHHKAKKEDKFGEKIIGIVVQVLVRAGLDSYSQYRHFGKLGRDQSI